MPSLLKNITYINLLPNSAGIKLKGNIIICGAPRSGTTALYRYLSAHPSVAISQKKEMNYFLGGEFWKDTYDTSTASKQNYQNAFTDFTDGMWSLEASPGYMHPTISNRVSKRINNIVPEAKLIFLLRDPIMRMRSHFNTEKRSLLLNESMTFEEFIKVNFDAINEDKSSNSDEIISMIALEIGCYVKVLKEYISNNHKNKKLVIFTESLLKNTESEMKRIAHFIGMDELFYEEYQFIRENQYHATRNKRLYLLAGKINAKLEPVLNKAPFIRHYIREIYYKLNTTIQKNAEEQIDTQLLNKLDKHFSLCNQGLKQLLSTKAAEIDVDETKFPKWLKG